MPARKTTQTSDIQNEQKAPIEDSQKEQALPSFLRFGESYTSLVLGIVVVIIATVLLLSFVHNSNVSKSSENILSDATSLAQNITIEPTNVQSNSVVSATEKSTHIVTKNPTSTNNEKPSVKVSPSVKPTTAKSIAEESSVKIQPKKVKVNMLSKNNTQNNKQKKYIVKVGDSLWAIAEREYKSGYNWVDIAQANKLADPSNIHKDDHLVIPKVEPKLVAGVATQAKQQEQTTHVMSKTNTQTEEIISLNKIDGSSYVVISGDNLWSIAIRAYGDGYQWTKIAQANKLTNPSYIHSGNVLMIPR